jgi:hypothetical protein
MLESLIQKKIIDYCNKLWYITVKLEKTNCNWIADLEIHIWDSKTILVEVKQENWKQSELQKYRQKQFEAIWDIRITAYGYNDFINKFKQLWNQQQK